MPQRVSAGQNIGDLLLREGLVTNAQLDEALAKQRDTDQPLIRILVESGALDETKRLNFFKRQFGVPMVSLTSVIIDPILYTYIPANLARKHHLVPIKADRDGLVVAMEDPTDLLVLDHLKEIIGLRIKPVIALSVEIQEALKGYPEERESEEKQSAAAERFDFAVRFLSFSFLPILSAGALLAIFGLLWVSPASQQWLKLQLGEESATRGSQMFTLFLYFFLSWGVYTIILFEIRGLVFDDMEWRDAADLGEEKSRKKALILSLLLGWLGLDRFYLGYSRLGLLKLLTLGLLGLWWILDVLLLAVRAVPDGAGRPLK